MDRRDLLRADIAVSLNLVSADEAANGGLLSLSDVDQTRIEQEMATVLDAAEGDVDRALRDRGIDAGLNAHLEADVSHALAESGTRSRTRLRTLEKGRYAGFMPLGEGGMGTVYLALDTELNRKVAFKMIRTGGAGPTTDAPTEVREDLEARFFQEAWVTGSLEHPGIVPIYELGRTPSGVPYYTMRLIRGERTLDTAIQEAATPEERLALLEPFLKVCDAIRYAHARHVVHRDLKPANVALGPYGEVVVLDWGLAKLQEERAQADSRWQERLDELREQTDLKTLASALGTPGFMAPEAALGRVAEVDARSDVYSLGAILHLVLTGRYPFSFGSYADYVRAVQQGIESVLGVPAGLERICLQAMATEREERYADAGALAADIRRWQAESVLARERDALDKEVRSAFEVLDSMEGDGKLQQLDRVVALASRMRELAPDDEEPDAILARVHAQRADTMRARERTVRRALLRRVAALALLVGTGAAVLVAVLLEGRRREAVDARAQESMARAQALDDRGRAVDAMRRAESERARAEELAQFMLFDLRNGLAPIGRVDLLKGVALKSLEYYESLPEGEDLDVAKRRLVALANVSKVLVTSGDEEQARRGLEESVRLARKVVAARPEDALAARDLAVSLNQLGYIFDGRQEYERANELFDESLALRRRIVAVHPDRKDFRYDLALVLSNLAGTAIRQGRLDEGMKHAEEARAVLEPQLPQQPRNTMLRRAYLNVLENVQKVHQAKGQWPEAIAVAEVCVRIGRELVAIEPENRDAQRAFGVTLAGAARMAQGAREFEKSEKLFRESIAIRAALAKHDPNNLQWQIDHATGLIGLTLVLRATGREQESIELGEQAVRIRQGVVDREPERAEWQRLLAIGTCELARTVEGTGDLDRAAELFARGLAAHDRALAKMPSLKRENELIRTMKRGIDIQLGLASPANAVEFTQHAMSLYRQKRFAEAATQFEKALADPAHRADLRRAALYNGACAASLTGTDAWLAKALVWIREDLALRRARIAAIDEKLAGGGLDATARGRLERERAQHEHSIVGIRERDDDFKNLRARPGFSDLFPE